MKKYYIPKTIWFDYHEMGSARIERAIAMAGGIQISLLPEPHKQHLLLSKIVAFECHEDSVKGLQLTVQRLLNETVSVYEYVK